MRHLFVMSHLHEAQSRRRNVDPACSSASPKKLNPQPLGVCAGNKDPKIQTEARTYLLRTATEVRHKDQNASYLILKVTRTSATLCTPCAEWNLHPK
jgi:hypothetical protein